MYYTEKMSFMKRIIFISIMVLLSVNVFAQTVFLTFTGRDSYGQHVPLDSVLIRNLTRGWQQSFFWPDSSFFIMQVGTGIDDYYEANISPMFQLSQNSPNPFNGTTSVQLTIVEPGAVTVEITDISGRIVELKRYPSLQPGVHKLRISLSSPGVYFLTARIDGHTSSVKMINQGVGSADMIDYQGMVNESGNSSDLKSASKSINSYPFQLGDEMEYVGFSKMVVILMELLLLYNIFGKQVRVHLGRIN